MAETSEKVRIAGRGAQDEDGGVASGEAIPAGGRARGAPARVGDAAEATPAWSAKLGAGFRALRHRNYRLFFFGQLISLVGTWMQSVAQGWLVLQLAGSNADLLLGVTAALQFTPVLLFSMFGGALADRLPKRKVLIGTQSVMMVLAFVLAVLDSTHVVQIWHVLVLATLLGVANCVDMPARQAFVVDLVGKDDLMNAIALNSSVFNAARVVGPAIAGLLIAGVGVAGCFYLNGVSFIAVIAGLLLMRPPFFNARNGKPARGWDHEGGLWQSLGEGLRYIRNTPAVLAVILLVGAVGTFGLNLTVWMPVMARDVLHVGPDGYGLMMSAMGVGSLAAALALAYGAKQAKQHFVVGAACAFGVVLLAFSTVSWFPLALVLMALLGMAMVTFSATANTTVQLAVPDELRGRIMAVYMMVFAGTTPIGSLLAGGLAHLAGTPVSIAAGAVVCLLAVAATLWAVRGRRAQPAAA